MAKEKFIIGKKDNGNHDGRASNVRREQEANEQQQEWQRGMPIPKQQEWIIRRKMPRMPRTGK